MNVHDKVTIPQQVLVSKMDEEMVILDLASGTYFGLNPVGAEIWQFLSAGKTIAETCQAMVDRYEVAPSEIERDVVQLLQELLAKNLVQIL